MIVGVFEFAYCLFYTCVRSALLLGGSETATHREEDTSSQQRREKRKSNGCTKRSYERKGKKKSKGAMDGRVDACVRMRVIA